LKDKVYVNKSYSLHELKDNIQQHTADIQR